MIFEFLLIPNFHFDQSSYIINEAIIKLVIISNESLNIIYAMISYFYSIIARTDWLESSGF